MPRTIGYHFVKSGYGLWLPGDERGHWSDAWDEQIGYYGPHQLHPGDPVRLRMAEELMTHPVVKLSASMVSAVECAIERCTQASVWKIVAASVEPTHTHLLLTYSTQDIHKTCKWIADQTTKAVHILTDHVGPVWGKGKWCQFVYDDAHWRNVIRYIERHNERRGVGPRPYAWVSDWESIKPKS